MSDMKLELIIIPVSDVDRAAAFYQKLGWRLDADFSKGDHRRLQFTPPGSPASVMFGRGVTSAPPGTAKFMHLAVSDVVAARKELADKGIEVSEVFHDASGINNRFDASTRAAGPAPERRSYASFASFSDPDGNVWLLQEITARLPGRV
jgi:catechol 2,3-dioxygenase-like lactoylglutathione lyase family enzyme